MNAPKATQVGPERRPCTLAGVAVDFAAAVSISIPGPLAHAVADGGMDRMAATIALPFVRIQDGAVPWDILGNQVVAGTLVRVIADPETLLTRFARDDADNGGTILRIGPVPSPLIGPPPGWVTGMGMGRAFFPRRSDTIRRPQRRCRASPQSAQSCSDWPGGAGSGYGAVCVTAVAHARGGPWAHLWRTRGAATPRWPGVAAFPRRRCPSAACISHRRPDSGRLGNALVPGTGAARSAQNVGRLVHLGGGDVRAKACTCCHPGVRRSESLSRIHDTIPSTLVTHEPKLL